MTPLWLCQCSNETEVIRTVADKVVAWLVDDRYQIPAGRNGYRRIKPSDIGVIVRTNKQGKYIKRELSRRNVPAVIMTDLQVWNTDEALDVYYPAAGCIGTQQEYISRALLNPYFGYGTEQIIHLDDKKNWPDSGF